MGLFDFLKKQEKNESHKSEMPKSELFLSLSKYKEYIVQFIHMQQQGDYAPISAYEKSNGEIVGFLYVIEDYNSYSIPSEEVINKMEDRFKQKLKNNDINSFVILYHSQFANDNNHKLANNYNESKAITVSYNFKNEIIGKIALPYSFEENSVVYEVFDDFTQEENSIIFATKLEENKNYFQDREEVKPPVSENEIGLKIKKSNALDLKNTWSGIFGFESYKKSSGAKILVKYFGLALNNGKITKYNDITISKLDYSDISLKGISLKDEAITFLPVIKTDHIIDVVNREINEWENVENLEAVITAGGRGGFGLAYFATDYAENREKYLSKKEHKIKISGIAFVLDIIKSEILAKSSDDFTMYMPNKDLASCACFDFVGKVEDFRETFFLEDNSQKGYLMKVRLVTEPNIQEFLTIDIFVNLENMRFKKLVKGMRVSGMFQMQGELAD
ncbi:hypothetical protein CSB07_00795 [Candidatus Gracilibacteria bacterium]|nr:MAG: hypothetical protein CSB07_00795 [Candidatus Gracilibacteria bacterium]PIE85010.1 MAG: hypothetical protein CSA08_04175 [Candidatus Gracilibacteria bacterium]